MQFSMMGFAQEFFTSAIFIMLVVGLRTVLIRMARGKHDVLGKERRRWVTRIKNGTFVVVFIGLAMIWAPQLQTFALSLTAFVVAFVIATKEMILCFTGSLLRMSTQPYKVGDWVTIDSVMGEVVDIDAFTTRVEEIDHKTLQYTGKKITIPNAKLFTTQVENKNFIKNYMFMDIALAVQCGDIDPSDIFNRFQDIVAGHIAPLRADADSFMKRVSRKAGIDFRDASPSFGMRTSDLGHYIFTTRICVPTAQAEAVNIAITRDFLSFAAGEKKRLADLRKANDNAGDSVADAA